MNKNNLKLWNSVEKTNPKYTKKAKIGGMSITAIAPQYQIMMVTEQFGVYGQTWGFKKVLRDEMDCLTLICYRFINCTACE